MCNDHIDEQCHIALSYNISINTGIPSVTQQHQTPLPISLDINQRTPTACADPEKCALTVHEPLHNHCSSTTPQVTHHQCFCSITHSISSVCTLPPISPMSSLDVPLVWVYITTPTGFYISMIM